MTLNILLFSFLCDWYHKLVSLQNDDTRDGPPPCDVTAALLLLHQVKKLFKGYFLSLDRYIWTYIANLNIKNA